MLTSTKTAEVEQIIAKIEEKTKRLTKSNQDVINKQKEIEKQDINIEIEKEEADNTLAQALPSLKAAEDALGNIKREDLQELKAFNNPPIHVKIVCQMCTVLCPTGEKLDETWGDARKMLSNTRLLDLLKAYPKGTLTEKMYQRCKQILRDNKKHGITVENLATKSQAGQGLLVWVFAIMKYYEVAKYVEPLRKKVKAMEMAKTKSKQELRETNQLLISLDTELTRFRTEYEEAKNELSILQHQSSQMEKRLQSAVNLISGLNAEQTRWKTNHDSLKKEVGFICGNALIFACFQSYCGIFYDEFRKMVIHAVHEDLLEKKIPFDSSIDPHMVVVNNAQLHEWASMGLPMDTYSVQNMTILLMGKNRFPLCIDPQGQALKWIKTYHESSNKQLCIKSVHDKDYIKHLEVALEYGHSFILENLEENDIDNRISNVLLQKFEEENGYRYVQLNEKRIEWNNNFCLYLCTKLENPHYTPEIFSTLNLVNFEITKSALTDKILSIVLKQERPVS